MIPRASFASLFAAPAQRRIQGLSSFPRTLSRLSLSQPYRPANPFLSRGVRSYPRSPTKPDSSFGSGFTDAVNRLPSTAVVVGIIAVNGVVFMMWQGAKGEAQSGNWKELKWMSETFLCSADNLRNGRYWVLLTSCFSHEGLGHLFFNCFTFYFVGSSAIQMLGNSRFLALYLGAGIFGNVVSAVWHKAKNEFNYASHGASGAVYGVLSWFACVAPTAMFYLYGIIPIPAFVIVPGILAWDTWNSLGNKKSSTDHSGHVGGILGGVLYFLFRSRLRL